MKKILNIIIALSLVMLVGCAANETTQEDTQEPETKEDEVIAEVEKTSLTLTFAGDITLGNYVGQGYDGSFNQLYKSVDKSYFFKNVKDIFKESDLTIANMEGPLTDATDYVVKTFTISGLPEYNEILKDANIDVMTVANNHSMDYYQQGLDDTRENLDAVGISHFGYSETAIEEVNGKKIGFIGLSFPDSLDDETKELIDGLKDKTDIIVIYVHWGIERDEAPQSSQIELAHSWIDYGVDLVIGSHPHVVQGIESYKGKSIVYSLGNFCFGANKNPSDKDSMIYQHTFNFEDDEIVEESENIIACSISSSSSSNNYQPTVLEGDEKTRVENKIQKRSDLISAMIKED